MMGRWLLAATGERCVCRARHHPALPRRVACRPVWHRRRPSPWSRKPAPIRRFRATVGSWSSPALRRPKATSARSTVWLRDRSNGGEIELTQPQPGARIGDSTFPVISGDGCYAAVLTEMPFDLFRDDDTGDRWDVYRIQAAELWRHAQQLGADLHQRVPRRRLSGVPTTSTPIPARHLRRRFGDRLHAPVRRRPSRIWPGIIVVDLTVPDRPARPLRCRWRARPPRHPTAPSSTPGLREPSVSDDGQFVAFTSDANSSKAGARLELRPDPRRLRQLAGLRVGSAQPRSQHRRQARIARARQHRQRRCRRRRRSPPTARTSRSRRPLSTW